MQKSALLCKIQHTFVKFCIHTPHVQIFDTCTYFLMLKSAFKSASASANIRIRRFLAHVKASIEIRVADKRPLFGIINCPVSIGFSILETMTALVLRHHFHNFYIARLAKFFQIR